MQTGKFRGFEVTMHDPGIALLTFNQPEHLKGMKAFQEKRTPRFNRWVEAKA